VGGDRRRRLGDALDAVGALARLRRRQRQSVVRVASSHTPVAKWQHSLTSPKQRDVVPSKALPPLGAWDRMPNGEHLGHCPTCGADEWWDNPSRKAPGQMKRGAPDYICALCSYARWIAAEVTSPVCRPSVARRGRLSLGQPLKVVRPPRPTWRSRRRAVLGRPAVRRAHASRRSMSEPSEGRLTVLRSSRGRRDLDDGLPWRDQTGRAVAGGRRA
jgi:hypothetical protein